MTDVEIVIGIEGRPEGGRVIKRTLDDVGNSADRANRATDVLRRTVVGLAGAFGARELIRFTDSITVMETQLRNVTRGASDFNAKFDSLYAIAQRNGDAVGDLTANFVRLNTSLPDSIRYTTDLTKVTEILSRGFAASGASAQASGQIMTQLTQGLAGNFANAAQEINSLIEGAPLLARVIAEQLGGKAASDLKKFAEEGRLATQSMLGAIIASEDTVKSFAIPPTIERSWTRIGNAFARVASESDLLESGVTGLAGLMDGLAENFDTLATAAIATGGALATRYVAGAVAANVASLTLAGTMSTLGGIMATVFPVALIAGAIFSIIEYFDELHATALLLGGEIAKFGASVHATFKGVFYSAVMFSKQIYDVISSIGSDIRDFVADPLEGFDGSRTSAAISEAVSGSFTNAFKEAQEEAQKFGWKVDDYVNDTIISIKKNAEEARAAKEELLNPPPAENGGGLSKELQKLAESQAKWSQELGISIEQASRLYEASILSEEAYRRTATAIEIENTLRQQGYRIGSEVYNQRKRELEQLKELESQTDDNLEAWQKEQQLREEYARTLEQPFINLVDNVQREFADMIAEWDFSMSSMVDLAKRAAAEVVAALTMRAGIELVLGTGSGAGTIGSLIGSSGNDTLSGSTGGLSNLSTLGKLLSDAPSMSQLLSGNIGGSSALNEFGADYLGTSLSGKGGFTNASLSGTALSAGVGAVAASLLGLSSGNFAVDTGASLAGAYGGGALATQLGFGSFAGPAGVIGSLALTALGGSLFGNKSRPHPAAGAATDSFTANGIGNYTTGFKHLSKEDAEQFASSFNTYFGTLSQSAGIDLSILNDAIKNAGPGAFAFSGGVDDGTGYLSLGTGDKTKYRAEVTFDPEDETAFNTALGEFSKIVLMRVADLGGEVNGTLLGVLDRIKTEGRSVEEVMQDIAFASAFDTLGQFPQEMSQVEASVATLRDTFNEAAETAERLGLSVEKVREFEETRMQQLQSGYVQGIAQSILQSQSPATLQQMQEQQRYQQQLRDLKELGATQEQMQMAELLHQINLQTILEQNSTLQTAALDTEQERLRVANDTAARFSRAGSSLQSILFDLTNGQYSPLHPTQNLDQMRETVRALGQRAGVGDIEAAEELASLIPKFVQLSGEVNGFNATFEADRAMAESLTRQAIGVAERQTQLQTQIASAAQEQIDVLRTGFNALETALQKLGGGLTTEDIVNAANGLSGLSDPQAWATKWGRNNGYLGANETATGGLLTTRINAAGGTDWARYAEEAKAAGYANGGLVTGGYGGIDDISARLTANEFVMKRDAVEAIGVPHLNYMNQTGSMPSNDNAVSSKLDAVIAALHALGRTLEDSGNLSLEVQEQIRAALSDIADNGALANIA